MTSYYILSPKIQLNRENCNLPECRIINRRYSEISVTGLGKKSELGRKKRNRAQVLEEIWEK